jgi:hypothetical protein
MYITRAKTSVKSGRVDQKRLEMRTAYEDIVYDTMAFARVAADKISYNAMIDELNGLISNYNTSVTLRLAGRSTENGDVDNMVATAAS